jgi:hypothetical protein
MGTAQVLSEDIPEEKAGGLCRRLRGIIPQQKKPTITEAAAMASKTLP